MPAGVRLLLATALFAALTSGGSNAPPSLAAIADQITAEGGPLPPHPHRPSKHPGGPCCGWPGSATPRAIDSLADSSAAARRTT
jgi:hypothetical protein